MMDDFEDQIKINKTMGNTYYDNEAIPLYARVEQDDLIDILKLIVQVTIVD